MVTRPFGHALSLSATLIRIWRSSGVRLTTSLAKASGPPVNALMAAGRLSHEAGPGVGAGAGGAPGGALSVICPLVAILFVTFTPGQALVAARPTASF